MIKWNQAGSSLVSLLKEKLKTCGSCSRWIETPGTSPVKSTQPSAKPTISTSCWPIGSSNWLSSAKTFWIAWRIKTKLRLTPTTTTSLYSRNKVRLAVEPVVTMYPVPVCHTEYSARALDHQRFVIMRRFNICVKELTIILATKWWLETQRSKVWLTKAAQILS